MEPISEYWKQTFKVDLPKMLVGMALQLGSGWRTFKLMKPGNGIETAKNAGIDFYSADFQINETR